MREYFSPEPLLQEPDWVREQAQRGVAAPTYAYALNNPIRNTEPTGLESPPTRGGEFCPAEPNYGQTVPIP